MTKASFSALFKMPLSSYRHFLIYGNDTSVFRRSIAFICHKIPYRFEEKTESDFLASVDYPQSLFASSTHPPCFLVSQVSEKILPHLSKMPETYLIFTTEKARANSKLVSYFTTTPRAVAISAYASPLCKEEFDSLTAELSLPSSFKNQLFSLYQNDVEGLLSTLEKIRIFGTLSEPECKSFLDFSAVPQDIKEVQEAFLLRDPKKAIQTLALPLFSESIALLRILNRTFLILFDALSSQNLSWEKLSFPLFFKEKATFQTALSLWTKQEVSLFLRTLLRLENRVKYLAWSPPEVHHTLLEKIVSRETI